MRGYGAFALSITIAALSLATFVHAMDPQPSQTLPPGKSKFRYVMELTACMLKCPLPDFFLECIFIGVEYESVGKMKWACMKSTCDDLLQGARKIYEHGSCESQGGRLAKEEDIRQRRGLLLPEPREKPLFANYRSGKQ